MHVACGQLMLRNGFGACAVCGDEFDLAMCSDDSRGHVDDKRDCSRLLALVHSFENIGRATGTLLKRHNEASGVSASDCHYDFVTIFINLANDPHLDYICEDMEDLIGESDVKLFLQHLHVPQHVNDEARCGFMTQFSKEIAV